MEFLEESVLVSPSCRPRMGPLSTKLPSETEVRVKTLRDWRRTAKAVLKARCAHYGLSHDWPKELVSRAHFTHFNLPQPGESSSNMEDASFVITEGNQEHRSQEATQKSNSAPTASKEIVGLSLQELCALIRSEVSIAIQLPTKQHLPLHYLQLQQLPFTLFKKPQKAI